MKNKLITITIILIGLLLAIFIIYLGITQNMTYDKALKRLQETTYIIINEQTTAEQIAASKPYNIKIISKKQIKKIIDFIASGKENKEECWHNLTYNELNLSPSEYEVKFLNKNNDILTKINLNSKDNHIHLEGEGYNYKIDLNVEKLIQLFHEKA